MSVLHEESSPLAAAETTKFSSDMSVAALLLTIGHEQAARVMRGLDHEQLKQVTRAMNDLRDKSIDQNTICRVLGDAIARVHGGQGPLEDVAGRIESIMGRAFGEHAPTSCSASDDPDELIARQRFAVFEALSSQDLANLLAGEHPQIAAVFVAHLDHGKAAAVVNHMAESKRPDLVYRVATLDRTPPAVVQRVLDVMTQRVESLGLTARSAAPRTWIKAAAAIVNRLGCADESILHAIGDLSADIADSIRDEMFTFDDIASLGKRSIQRVLSLVETKTLVLALKKTSRAVEQKVFDNLSRRAREMVADERDLLGPTPTSKVFDAQRSILRTIRELSDRGEIDALRAARERMA